MYQAFGSKTKFFNIKSFFCLSIPKKDLNTKKMPPNIEVCPESLRAMLEYLRNRKHVPCFYRVIQTRVEVWENEKCCGNTCRRQVFPQLFRVLPNFHECLYNSIETWSTCCLFLLENNATRKRKTTC